MLSELSSADRHAVFQMGNFEENGFQEAPAVRPECFQGLFDRLSPAHLGAEKSSRIASIMKRQTLAASL